MAEGVKFVDEGASAGTIDKGEPLSLTNEDGRKFFEVVDSFAVIFAAPVPKDHPALSRRQRL